MKDRLYRYAHDRQGGRLFTQSAWLHRVHDHFIRLDSDTDITFELFLIGLFQDHLIAGTIVPVVEDEQRRPPPKMGTGCPFCHPRYNGERPYPFATISGQLLCFRRIDAIVKDNARDRRLQETQSE